MYYSPIPTTHLKKWPVSAGDLTVLALVIVFVYGTVSMARHWTAGLQLNTPIELGYGNLFVYSLYSLNRALIAYALSLFFTLAIGYWAGKSRAAEKIILPLLDIGQSIPVLGFLPGLVLGLISIFPHSNTGLELACILMIFTGQVWNMTFSFYASLKAVPTPFHELSTNIMLTPFQKLLKVELPYSASGLAWNSLMSMAGGWFFLTVCEAFTLGDQQFRLPGLGSYMALAIDKGDTPHMMAGVCAMIAVIVGVDFVLWRPIIAWTRKFRLDEAAEESQDIPFMQLLFHESKIGNLFKRIFELLSGFSAGLFRLGTRWIGKAWKRSPVAALYGWIARLLARIPTAVYLILLAPVALVVIGRLYLLLSPIGPHMALEIALATLKTFLRVAFSLVFSVAWALPCAIWIGRSSKLTRIFQPLIQVAASFPAPMLYPLVLGVLTAMHVKIGAGSAVLMMLGVQWYVLFNVLAGATTISKELRDTYNLIGVSRAKSWTTLYLPSVMPSLVTGVVTAAGGAWNASIVAEYIQYKGETLSAQGLGALISIATAKGDFVMLGGGLIAMVAVVVSLNNFVWRPLYSFVGSRYRFER